MTMRAERIPATAGSDTAPIPFGLTQAERADLEWYWGGYEADIGVGSTFGAMVQTISGVAGAEDTFEMVTRGSGGLPASDERLLGLHFDKRKPLERASRIYRALSAMTRGQSAHVTVLWLLHGPTRPAAFREEFGDVAPIVHLTSTVEDARLEMANSESERREAATAVRYDSDFTEFFWECAGEARSLEERIAARRENPRMQGAAGQRVTARLEAERTAWREVMRRIIDGRLAARITAIASADHELTPRDAIRHIVEYRGPRDDAGKPMPEPHKAHQRAIKPFVSSVRLEADRMRIAAAIAYREALKAVRP